MREEAQAFPRPDRRAGCPTLAPGGRPHELLFCGPGRLSVEEALAERSPASILHVGFAGSLRPEHEIGACFEIASIRSGPDLLEVPRGPLHDFQSELEEARLVTAPGPMTAADKQRMQRDDAGDLVDMESFHVLRFCRDRGIPYRGIRVVSDLVDEELPEVLLRAFDGRRFRLAVLIRGFLFDRSSRGALLRLRRQARTASEALAARLF